MIPELTQQHLSFIFDSARKKGSDYVFVKVSAREETEEVIVLPKGSFDAKEAYYKKAYSDSLVHVMNDSVCIIGLHHGKAGDLEKLI